MNGGHSSIISSYLGWWSAAGLVDSVGDEACDWLSAVPPAVATASNVAVPAVPATRSTVTLNDAGRLVAPEIGAAVPVAMAKAALQGPLPDDLDGFDSWLASRPALPGAMWSGPPVLPYGPVAAPLMIMSDAPDEDDLVQGALFAGAPGRLLDAMLAAIGLTREAVRVASIALTRPPAGRIEGADSDTLLAMARHQISIARPRHLLLLGQQTCSLLTGEVVPPDGLGQRQINLSGGMRAAIAIHHPRLLLKQPLLKRPAWTALKPLKEPS